MSATLSVLFGDTPGDNAADGNIALSPSPAETSEVLRINFLRSIFKVFYIIDSLPDYDKAYLIILSWNPRNLLPGFRYRFWYKPL
jgi:hypothetical protein